MLFLFLAISTSLRQSEVKLARRANTISFKKSNIVPLSNEDSWYFVKFDSAILSNNKIISDLQKQGIQLKSTNCVSKNIFSLYLTPLQARYILKNNFGEIHEIQKENKIANSPTKKWSFLTIETADSHELIRDFERNLKIEKCALSFQYFTKETFSIQGKKECLESAIPLVSSDKRVYAITYDNYAEELNCRASGFTQKNTDKATVTKTEKENIVEIDRFLNKQGLDGSGVKVYVVDTYLDTNSTFFYDPNHPKVELNQLIEGHRKIDYINVLEEAEMANNDHGTHTAGSITGKALNDASNEAKYNGCAPNSRLSFYSSTYRDFIPDEINKVADLVKPQISTNSWGRDYESPLHDSVWDQISYDRNNTLYIFSAGNSAASGEFYLTEGYKSLRSPGSAKNVLTVGSSQSVRVDEKVIGEDNKEIYMTDETDESTHLTKILKWSLQDYDKNIGMKTLFEQGRLKVQISRNPSKLTNTTVLVIDNIDQFNKLSKEEPPYFVISTFEFEIEDFSSLKFKHTFPVLYLSEDKIPQYESNILETNYRNSEGYQKADFSSMGTGNLGLMKPDVMCPGVSIVSARAVVGGSADQKEVTIKHGTSMATPICAGASAIIYQYFMEGKYRNEPKSISSSLARSFMIACSEPMKTIYPNTEEGYGLVNLGKFIGNGIETDNKRILIGDRLKIIDNHMMSTVSVGDNNDNLDLIISLSYLDLVLSADSAAALAVDLDLVVVSPSKKVYRGNQRPDNTEERYSTNERVIIKSNDVEKGDYEIHVFVSTSLNNVKDSVDFAMTILGPLDNDKNGKELKFVKATKCIPDAGLSFAKCDEETMENICGFNYFGRSCQSEGIGFGEDAYRKIIKIQPYGISYVSLYYPFGYEKFTYTVVPVTVFEPKIAVFFNNTSKGGAEIEADIISDKKGFTTTCEYDPNFTPQSEIYALLMIYNTSPYPTDFVITSDIVVSDRPPFIPPVEPPFDIETETPNIDHTTSQNTEIEPPTSSSNNNNNDKNNDNNQKDLKHWKKLCLVSIVIACVFCVITIVLIVFLILFLLQKKKRSSKSDSMISIQSSLLD